MKIIVDLGKESLIGKKKKLRTGGKRELTAVWSWPGGEGRQHGACRRTRSFLVGKALVLERSSFVQLELTKPQSRAPSYTLCGNMGVFI